MTISNICVSVITVVYNLVQSDRLDLFKQMLHSVQIQTYQNIEHFIIDGDSNDGTKEFLKMLLSDKRNVNYISEPDTGIYNAFNKGIKLSKGDLILFLNSDDFFWDESSIESLVTIIQSEHIDFVCAKATIISDKKHSIFSPQIKSYLVKTPFCHQTMLCKKEILTKYGGFNENFKYAADYELIVKLLYYNHSYSILDKIVVGYRAGGVSGINAKETKEEVIYAVHSIIFEKVLTEKETYCLFTSYFPLFPIIKVLLSRKLNIRTKIETILNLKHTICRLFRLRFIIVLIENLIRRKYKS